MGFPELASVLNKQRAGRLRSAVQWRNDSASPSLDSVDGLGSGWAAVPGAESRVVTSLDAAGPDVAPGGAGNGTALECGAALRPQPPPSTWHPLNSTGATSHLAHQAGNEQHPHAAGHDDDHALGSMPSPISVANAPTAAMQCEQLARTNFAGQHRCMQRSCQRRPCCAKRQTASTPYESI